MMLQNLHKVTLLLPGAIMQTNRYAIIFKTHLTNYFDLAINDLGYEHSQDSILLNNFDCVFVHKEVTCKNETKNHHYQVI